MKRKRKSPHKLLIFTCWTVGITLALMLLASLFLHFLTGKIQYTNIATTPSLTQEELDAYLSTELSQKTQHTPVFLKQPAKSCGWDSDILNILLIGQDRREGETRARADSMILCTFHKDSATLTMTSFLRDLYVAIPGYRNNRINAAYTAGGMPLLRQTFLENFGIAIDGCVEVDFNRFSQLVDLMGGVTLELRQDEAELLNTAGLGNPLQSGTQLLNGSQALAYARIRSLDPDGDFSRTSRQRKIITALLENCKNASLPDTLKLLSSTMSMLTTDMQKKTIFSIATELLPMFPQLKIISQHVPVEGAYHYSFVNGMSVLMADMAATRAFLEESLMKR